MVPGGSEDGSDGDEDCDGGSERMKLPSRRKQFLGFVALSEWLLQQLGNDGVGGVGDGRRCASAASSSPLDAPTTVCVNILRGCQVS